MNKQYRLVVFDWEGTLGDTLGQILHIIAHEAKRLQLGEFDICLSRQYVNLGLERAVKKIFPNLLAHQYEQLLGAIQHSLLKDPMDTYLIPGAKSIVQQIHKSGIDLAIATNKGEQSLQKALQVVGLNTYFRTTRSAGQTPAKPCPKMLEEIIETCETDAMHTLMVGDSEIDIEMAKQINVDAVGVNFCLQQAADLLAAGALEVFDDYQQLAKFLHLPGAG